MYSSLLFFLCNFRKLKNRVAAQTSRDRKKAKMEQMEQALKELFNKNETLLTECKALKEANEKLMAENAELHNRLSAPCVNCHQNRSVECDGQRGSAESLNNLPPKGLATHSAAALGTAAVAALWKIVLAFLLYQTCSMNSTQKSTLNHWNNSLRASFRISPEIWKQLLKKQVLK